MDGHADDCSTGEGPEVYRLARSHRIEDAAAAVARTVGSAVASIRRSAVGSSHAVYFVTLADGRRCVARFGTHPEHALAREVWATERGRAAGVPAPRLLALDLAPPDHSPPLAVYERLLGTPGHQMPLTSAERRTVLGQMARQAARLHAIQIAGAGRLEPVAAPIPPARRAGDYAEYAGTAASWTSHALAALERRLGELPPGTLPPQMLDAIRRRFAAGLPALEAAVPPHAPTSALIHADFRLENALLLRDPQGAVRVSAILDFEMAMAGDGGVDLAWLAYQDSRSEADLYAIIAAYGGSPGDPLLLRRLRLYQIHYALGHLWWEVEFKDHDGAARVVERIAALLAQTAPTP